MDTKREVKRILDQLTLNHARELDEEEAKRRKERKKREKEEQEKILERLERYFEIEPEEAHPDPSPEGAEKVQEKGQRKKKWYGKSNYL